MSIFFIKEKRKTARVGGFYFYCIALTLITPSIASIFETTSSGTATLISTIVYAYSPREPLERFSIFIPAPETMLVMLASIFAIFKWEIQILEAPV